MALFDRLLDWIARSALSWRVSRVKAAQRRGVGEAVMSSMMLGSSGIGYPGGWSQDRIEQVRHYKHWVYVAVGAKQRKISGLVPHVAHVTADDAPHSRSAGFRQRRFVATNKAVEEHEAVEHVGADHPLARLFRRPNAVDTAMDLWSELILFLELTGNAYLWTVPSGYGQMTGSNTPAELWVIPSHWVWPRSSKDRLIDYYEIRPLSGGGSFRFPAEQVIHFKYKSPLHKVDGYSPQTAAAEEIDQYESMQQARFWQFKNGCFPQGSVELGAQYGDPDDQDLERIYAKFFARLQGENNTGRPIICPPGAKYVPLSIAPAEMGYVQSVEQVRDIVLAHFGVPKEVAGIQDAGSEIAMWGPMAQFASNTINPLLQYLGQVLTMHLASRWGDDLRVWWDDVTPPNPTQVNADIDCDVRSGAITINEIRALRGREPYAHGGDDPLLPMTLSPLPLNTGDDLSGLADLRPIEARETIREDDDEEGEAGAAAGKPDEPKGPPPAKGWRATPQKTEDERRAELMEFTKSIVAATVAALRTEPAPAPVVNVTQTAPPPEVRLENHHYAGAVTVHVPETKVEVKAGDVEVRVPEAPQLVIPAPIVTNVVHVPPQPPAAVTNVVEPAPVVVTTTATRTEYIRDEAGELKEAVTRPEPPEETP